jgi:hypothetical protein
MTAPDPGPTNVAGENAHVMMQAGVVHGDVNFRVSPEDPPEVRFEKGARLLESDVPGRARVLIRDAVDDGYRTNRSFFYLLLALVSGRTRNEVPEEDAVRLRNRKSIRLHVDDAWADGVRMIDRLLHAAQRTDVDLRVLWKEFDALGPVQAALILKHFELFLDGPLQDQAWRRAMTRAAEEQKAGGRVERVWKFFHPDPAPPREAPTRPADLPANGRLLPAAATAVCAVTAVHLGYLLAQAGRVSALIACVLSVPAGYFGAHDGTEWRFDTLRRRAKDEEYRTRPRRRSEPSRGFAAGVGERLDHYFAKYRPEGFGRDGWLAETAGIRGRTRDELVEVFREQRTGVDKISWLLRHRAADVRRRWQNGTLWSHRWELATPVATRTRAVLALAAVAVGGIWALGEAVAAEPQDAAISTALLLAAGWIAIRTWLNITLEHRRVAADEAERKRTLEGDREALARWRAKLADRPGDPEMAAWLDCDRKVLLNDTLRHYRLPMSDVRAYAFVEAPTGSTRRARGKGGPWRYTRYRIVLFLLTDDGVRERTADLDFERGEFRDRHWANYRYDAIAAVRMRHDLDDRQTFELALVNGQTTRVQVTFPEIEDPEGSDDASEVSLDAAGLHHTLHILAGIAAEGKEWFAKER